MREFILFYNPVSGHAAFKKKLDWMIDAFQKRKMILIPYRTQKEGNQDFIEFVREIQPEGLVAAGGDGTVHEMVNLMMHHDLNLPLAIVGSGTSNDFATYLHINEDMERYFDRIAAGTTRRIDLGRVGKTYFINVASAGSMTSIAHEVDAWLKNAMGKMAYYLKGIGEIPKFHSFLLNVIADGIEYTLDTFIFVVSNSAVVGGMKNIARDVSVSDGKLDFLAVKKCSIPKLMTVTANLLAGKPISDKDYVVHIQAKHFIISSPETLESDLDGEIGPRLPLTIETVHKAISLFA